MRNRGPAQIPKRIDSIKFSLMNPNEIRKMSAVEVKTADTYKDDGHAYKQGLMDPKMGVIDPAKVTRCALENAVSVAVTILSTNAIITFDEER